VRGRGSPNSDNWRKSLALCLLCDDTVPYLVGWSVDGLLGGRGGMHSRHQTLQDSKVVIDDLYQQEENHMKIDSLAVFRRVSLVSYMVVGGMI
jgi:hypothetical protein